MKVNKMSKFKIRNNKNGTLDELVANNCDVHLEQMDNKHWWLSIDYVDDNGQPHQAHINLYTLFDQHIQATLEIDI